MTRPLLDTAAFLPSSTSGKAQIISDPANTWVSNVTTYVNQVQSDLDAASIPSTTGSIETKTSGAVSLTIPRTNLSVTGTVGFTLADGTIVGQTKVFECTVAASSPIGTLTIATPLSGEPATHVFNALDQELELIWQTGGWHITRKKRAGLSPIMVVGTTSFTGLDMNDTYRLSITGTVGSTLPDATVGDEGAVITLTCTTAATCPAGTITGTYLTTGNAAATGAAINATTDTAVFVGSGGGKWRALVLTSVTLS
jgi:hypothetical protein